MTLGYIAYFLICAFSYLQIGFMLRGRTRELGRVPLYTIVAGLALLQVQMYRDGVLTYLWVGNLSSLVGCTLTLALTYKPVHQTPAERRQLVESEVDRRVGAEMRHIAETRATLSVDGEHRIRHVVRRGVDYWEPRS